MSDRASATPQPRYQQVKSHILVRITSGEWRPSARVPSEGELTRAFGVSRMTVNRALRELASEGHITRVQGVGTFVAAPKAESTVLDIRNIAEEIRLRGQLHRCEVLRLAEERDATAARRLGLAAGASYFHAVLLHRADGVPVQLEDRRVNPAYAPGFLGEDLTRTTPHQHLMAIAPLQFVEHAVEAETASAEIAHLLAMSPGEPCLVLHRRTWAAAMVASVARFTYPGSRFRLTGHFGPGSPLPDVSIPPL